MADEYKIALQATIDDASISNLQTEVNNLSTKIKPIELKINTSNVESKIKNIRTQIENLSKIKIDLGAGRSRNGSVSISKETAAYKELLSIANQIDRLTLKAGGMKSSGVAGLDTAKIKETQNQLRVFYSTYQDLYNRLSQGNLNKTVFKGLTNDIKNTKSQLISLETELTSMQSKLVTGIKTNISNGNMGNQISNIENKFRSLNTESQEVSTNINRLKTLMSNMDSSDDIESVVTDYQEFQQVLSTTINQVKSLKAEQNSVNSSQRLTNARVSLSSDIDVWLQNNSAAAKQFGAELRAIQTQIQTADNIQLSHLKSQFQEVKKQAQMAGVAGKTMGDQFKQSLKTVSSYLSAAMLISRTIGTLRNMYNEVLKVDTAMTGLHRVTNLTNDAYVKLYDEMTDSAKKYGATLDDIINSTASWVRLGFNVDVAERLSEITAMYQHVTDLDYDTAVTNLVTAYRGYQEQLLELNNNDPTKAMTQIADIYDKLGNEMPVSAAQVGEGMTKAASVMEMAGATIEQATGMITGGGSVTQDFDAFGNALRVSALRIRGKLFCLHTRKGCMLCA